MNKKLFKENLLNFYLSCVSSPNSTADSFISRALSKTMNSLSSHVSLHSIAPDLSLRDRPDIEKIAEDYYNLLEKIQIVYDGEFFKPELEMSPDIKPAKDSETTTNNSSEVVSLDKYKCQEYRNNHNCSSNKELISKYYSYLICDSLILELFYYEYVFSDRPFYIISRIYFVEESVESARDIYSSCLDLFNKYRTDIKPNKDEYSIHILSIDNGNIHESTLDIFANEKLLSDDFFYNYNEDLPINEISDFIKMDRGGLCILNGDPGCGKSTLIKKLVISNSDNCFVLVPQEILRLNQEGFKNWLLRNCSSRRIFVIEDCEQLLISRDENQFNSSVISNILNYSSGILSDYTNSKFIFTFNTDIENIDKAILRKGRLRIKYEIKKLKGENLKKISEKIGYELTERDIVEGISLADLYYNHEKVIFDSKKNKAVGYGRS